MNVFVLGGSKNIGYFAALRLLGQGATVTFLLRNTAVFDDNAEIQPYVKDKKAILVRGDALKADDVKNAWQTALEAGQGKIDLVLFTVGGTPNFSFGKGFFLDTPDLCTRSLLTLFSSMPEAVRAPEAQPRFVVITSNGITSEAHSSIPIALKPMYNWLLIAPHKDKLGAERILAHVGGIPWTSKDTPSKEILPDGWEATPGLPEAGALKHLVIIRPAIYTDGAAKGDKTSKKPGKTPYRTALDAELSSAYLISRQDVAHFVVLDVVANWSKWEGHAVCIAY